MESRRFMVVISALFLSVVSAFPSFAMVATPSDAMAPVATSSNALPSQDYMESDDFDTLDVPVLMSSGDDVTNTVDITKCFLEIDYYDMSGVRHRVTKYFNSDGYASLAKPSDYVSTIMLLFMLLPVHFLVLVNIMHPCLFLLLLVGLPILHVVWVLVSI